MSNILLSRDEQGTVVFKFCKSLSYGNRLLLSFFLIITGLVLQIIFVEKFYIGCPLVFIGNLFLLVSGYDNRIKFGSYDPRSKWDKVDKNKMVELAAMQRKMQKWDMSSIDCSNLLGGVIMLIILTISSVLIAIGVGDKEPLILILGVNVAVLLLPHWVTGLRRISLIVKPALSRKMLLIREIIYYARKALNEHDVEYYMLLAGKKETKIPHDVKFKIEIKDHHPDFLGLYGQVVMNNVQGTLYPYFYTVLVAKKGYGLREASKNIKRKTPTKVKSSWISIFSKRSPGITQTCKIQKDVEVYVIRQTTTKTSGYHTTNYKAFEIFLTGLEIAEVVAKK